MNGSSPPALAWILAQGEHIVPIPGTKRRTYLKGNAEAVNIKLSNEELDAIGEATPKGAAAGQCYPEATMKGVNI
ncbi:aldo/keto reductase [Actinomycetes bacterium NPDC127524]